MQFAPAIVLKLREKAARHAELTEELSAPETAADPRRYPTLLKERGALEAAARMAERLEALQRRRADDEALLSDPQADAELVELARADLEALEQEERALDEEVRNALVSDQDDLRSKLIFEIRAGIRGATRPRCSWPICTASTSATSTRAGPRTALVVSGPTESACYRFGRWLAGFSGHYHVRNIYDIEAVIAARGLVRIGLRTLYQPVPLFRVTRWRLRT